MDLFSTRKHYNLQIQVQCSIVTVQIFSSWNASSEAQQTALIKTSLCYCRNQFCSTVRNMSLEAAARKTSTKATKKAMAFLSCCAWSTDNKLYMVSSQIPPVVTPRVRMCQGVNSRFCLSVSLFVSPVKNFEN